MADNIDKSLSQAPQGLEELAQAQPDLSIEIENPESVTLDDGSMEITITPGKEVDDEFNINLAEEYTKSYNEGSMEYVEVEKINGESYGYSLPIYLTIEIIDTIDLIPKVVDM